MFDMIKNSFEGRWKKMDESSRIILKNCSILLVEDEISLRQSFKKVLELYVNKVHEADNGEKALEEFNGNSVDIIFSDIRMPKMDGIELIKQVRKIDEKVPIVITSAYSDKSYLLESIKLSLVEYLIKPVKEKELLKVLDICAKIVNDTKQTIISLSDFVTYSYLDKTCKVKGEVVGLTAKEIDFLELLLLTRGHLVSKPKIESNLYMFGEAPPSALKNLVFKLRKKIGNGIIKTKGSLGYFIE